MPGANTVYVCAQAVDGSLQGCAATGSGFSQPEGIAISGGYAYVANSAPGTVSTCSINTNNGTLSGCTTSTVGSGPMGIALHGSRAYVSTRNGSIFVCDVSGTGALTNCAISNGGAAFGLLVQIAAQ
jgi:DNA-binding beta-propeller fold protein YncE